MKAWIRSPRMLPGAVVASILLIGGALMLLGTAQAPLKRQEFWSNVSSTGLQLTSVTVLGGLLTLALRLIDERRRRDEQRLQVFREIITAYNQVKAVRRNLRSLGMLSPNEPLTADQARGLREQMMILNQAQLSLEAIIREQPLSRLFKGVDRLTLPLGKVEKWLGMVYSRWEEHGGAIWEGSKPKSLTELELPRFIGRDDESREFKESVPKLLDEVIEVLRGELFGRPRGAPRSAALRR